MEYVAFGVGFGNLGRGRERMEVLVRRLNDRLASHGAGLQIRDWYGQTGNFVVASMGNRTVAEVSEAVKESPLRACNYVIFKRRRWPISPQTGFFLKLSGLLTKTLGEKFAVFTVSEFRTWLGALMAGLIDPPGTGPGRRATARAVMALDLLGGKPGTPKPSPWVIFAPFARARVRGVWRLDRLGPGGRTLDKDHQEGGWGAVAGLMARLEGGDWTARSLRTLRGLAAQISGA